MSVFDLIEQVGEVAERARARRAQTIPLSAEIYYERERHLIAYLCRWASLTAGSASDQSPIWTAFESSAFDDQLAQRSATDDSIRLLAYHGIDLGFWGGFVPDKYGLRALGVLNDEPASYELIEAVHSGRVTHVSLGARVLQSRERQKVGRDGWPIHDVRSAWLTEAGPTPADLAKDVGAVILSVGDSQPRWIGEVQRSKVLANTRALPELTR